MSMKKVVFVGCSFTAGSGWDQTNSNRSVKDAPDLWVNLCYNNIPRLTQLELINEGLAGGSNAELFELTINALSNYSNDIDTLFVQWTSGPRYNFNVGFELWDTSKSFFTEVNTNDINLADGTHLSNSYITDLLNRLRVLHHPHWEILKIVKYSNIIKSLSKTLNVNNVFFINGLCPWDENYFIKLDNVMPEDYTPFTKEKILQIKFKNDNDIFKLYNIAHTQYQEAGGIDPHNWLNLYNSFLNNRIDYNFDNNHPGIKSNQLYFEIVKSGLTNLGYI